MSHDALMKSMGISVTDGYERLMYAAAAGKVAPQPKRIEPPKAALHPSGLNRAQRRALMKKGGKK